MLIYRGYLLSAFHCQEPSKPPSSPLSSRARLCVENAMSMIALAADFGLDEGRYNGTFWVRSGLAGPLAGLLERVMLTIYGILR